MHQNFLTERYRRQGEPGRDFRDAVLKQRIRRLRASTVQASFSRAIADWLERCSYRVRCDLAVCPHCATAFQRFMMKGVKELWPRTTPLTKATIVPTELQRSPGRLHTLKLASVKRQLRRIFQRAGVNHNVVLGFVDVSINIHTGALWPAHWQPHAEFIVPTSVWLTMKEPLRAQLRSSLAVKIPLLGVPVKSFDQQVSYAFKPTPSRKTDFDRTSPKARPHKQSLKRDQELEFLLWLGLAKSSDRSFLLNVRRYGSSLQAIE